MGALPWSHDTNGCELKMKNEMPNFFAVLAIYWVKDSVLTWSGDLPAPGSTLERREAQHPTRDPVRPPTCAPSPRTPGCTTSPWITAGGPSCASSRRTLTSGCESTLG